MAKAKPLIALVKEHSIEQKLTKRVEALGGETRKVSWVGRRGAPDRLILLPGRAIWVELKRPKGGRLSALQIAEMGALQRAGCECYVVASEEDIERVLGVDRCAPGAAGGSARS